MTARRNAATPDSVKAGGQRKGVATTTNTTVTPDSEHSAKQFTLPTADDFPQRIRLSNRADAYLDRLADALVLDLFGLERLQGGLLALVLAGENWHNAENARLRDMLARAQRDADTWYWVANNPGKRPGDLYAAQTAEFWREGVV